MSSGSGPSTLLGLEAGRSFAVELGDSLRPDAAADFHAFRFDFKSGDGGTSFVSDTDKETWVGVVRQAASSAPEASVPDVYKGPRKEATEKDCVLLFDPKTQTFRLERLATNVVLKKTRREAKAEETSVSGGERERFLAAVERKAAERAAAVESDSSASDSDQPSDQDDEPMDADDADLRPVSPLPAAPPTKPQPPTQPPAAAATSRLAPNASKNSLVDDLRLSDSSDDD